MGRLRRVFESYGSDDIYKAIEAVTGQDLSSDVMWKINDRKIHFDGLGFNITFYSTGE